MAWLVVGLAALLSAALWPSPVGVARVAAAGLAAAGFAAAFWVYPPSKVVLAAAIASATALLVRRGVRRFPRLSWVLALAASGAACVLFALLGPAEGLF